MQRMRLLIHLNPLYVVRTLWAHRRLILQFAAQDFSSKFKGSFLGPFWAVLVPLLLLGVYTVVFSGIFGSRWQAAGREESFGFFALMIFAGMVPFSIFSECIASAPRLVLNSPNLVKKVVFPLEILPLSRVLSVLFQALISITILLLGTSLTGQVSPQFLLFPLAVIPLALFALGITYLFASFGVFVRDLNQFVGILITMTMFLSPVFYSLDAAPEALKRYLALNPLSTMIELFRKTTVLGEAPPWEPIAVIWAEGLVIALIGFAVFSRMKRAFADVM